MENSLEHTPTWAVSIVCFCLVLISLVTDMALHNLTHVCIFISLNFLLFFVILSFRFFAVEILNVKSVFKLSFVFVYVFDAVYQEKK